MLSPFVKGLMCATLLGLGVPSLVHLGSHLLEHAPVLSSFRYVVGFVASFLALALLLFPRGLVVARIAFGFLLSLAILHIGIPIWTTVTHTVPPTPKGTCLLYGFLYAVPCFLAIIARRDGAKNV